MVLDMPLLFCPLEGSRARLCRQGIYPGSQQQFDNLDAIPQCC